MQLPHARWIQQITIWSQIVHNEQLLLAGSVKNYVTECPTMPQDNALLQQLSEDGKQHPVNKGWPHRVLPICLVTTWSESSVTN